MADRVGALMKNCLLNPKNRISLYADDVVIFTNPELADLNSVKLLLQSFGEASRLFTNFNKSSILPIHCQGVNLNALSATLQCRTQEFPCTYLGLPLSDKRLRKGDLQPALDKLAGKVKGWNKGSFSLDARLLLVKHVLSAMNIYQLLVLDPPVWLIKAIDKLRRGFLWNNDELATGGRCLVRWATICRPLEFGGLGIPDLQRKSAALRVRWLWQCWISTDKPWSDLPIAMDDRTRSLFNAAVEFKLGFDPTRMHAELYVQPQAIGYQHAYINGVCRCSAGIRFTGMASSRTLAVILCVILALLAFVAQDALATRVLAEATDDARYSGGWNPGPGGTYPTYP
ncbi:hypothetical protein ACQ4PT_020764 [Festuca glaucescens]